MLAVIQLSSKNNKAENLTRVSNLITEASERGAKMVFLPEASDFIGASKNETLELAETLEGTFFTTIRSLAKKHNVWISVGSMHRKPSADSPDQRLLNTHIVLDNEGEIAAMYDKIHLFSVDLNHGGSGENQQKKKLSLDESRYTQPGKIAPVVARGTPVGNLGLAICYDLRFPELSSALRYRCGANVLAFPSAFTSATGNAGHWHTLLRARAIENQCFVVAAAQEGVHNPKLTSYGHSLVVDPFGRIIAERTEPGPGLLFADIHHDAATVSGSNGDAKVTSTERARSVLPVEFSRRHDLFPLSDAGTPIRIQKDDAKFGPITLKVDQIFYQTNVSMAFVNISPLVPGHVLVTPLEVVERFTDLPLGTIADMYACVKRIAERLCEHFGANSTTISIQDGKDAGQSVPHVHIHVLPRKPGDFSRNDDIYDALQKHDKVADRKYRTPEEMAEEARLFRTFFYDPDGDPLPQ